jgi:hypothetical protein
LIKQDRDADNRAAGGNAVAAATDKIGPNWRRGYEIRPGTEAMADMLYSYLDAWENHKKLGEIEFDDCLTVPELCLFLTRKLSEIQ